jgi:hypothetical protein
VLELQDIAPGPTDRAAIVGQTGSGKTYLARVLCESRPYVVALDAKGTLDWAGYRVVRSLKQLASATEPRLTYRPDYAQLNDREHIELFFEWCYRRGNTTVYADEVFAIGTASDYPDGLGQILTRGREMGVTLFGATQRPAGCPRILFSESEHVYAFYVKLYGDRQRLRDDVGIDPDAIGALPKRCFLYARQDGRTVRGPLTLAPSSPIGR